MHEFVNYDDPHYDEYIRDESLARRRKEARDRAPWDLDECGACDGIGYDPAGFVCPECNGSGNA